jgi:hypothetical protein
MHEQRMVIYSEYFQNFWSRIWDGTIPFEGSYFQVRIVARQFLMTGNVYVSLYLSHLTLLAIIDLFFILRIFIYVPPFCNTIIHVECFPHNILNIQQVNYKVFSMTAQFGLWEEGRHDICYDVIYGRFYCWLFGDWDRLWCVSGPRTSRCMLRILCGKHSTWIIVLQKGGTRL